jgi:hypothetical protein
MKTAPTIANTVIGQWFRKPAMAGENFIYAGVVPFVEGD